ncbi:MAG: CbiQ family ECF transporter T component, partial [Oceanidesulfovibrio sp.]
MIRDTPVTDAGPLQHVDIRFKLSGAVVLSCAMATIRTMDAAIAGLVLGLLLLALGHIRAVDAIRRLAPANGFFAFMLIALALTYPGRPWPLWNVVSLDGVLLGLRIAIKGNAMLCVLLTLVGTSTVASVAQGLQRLGAPRKLVLL